MTNLKVWPHLTIVAVLCAVLAGVGVAMWLKHEQTAKAEALPNAARIQRVDGDVALSNSTDNANAAETQWVAATENQPFSVGDRIYTRDNSRASLAFTGRNFARLNPNTSLDILSLADNRTQLALRDGSAVFDVGYLSPDELFEVATPYGAVDLQQPGLYNIGLDNGAAVVSVLSGLAQVVGAAGSGQINKGEVLRLAGETAANVVLSRINGDDAGYIVDDYYRYQYPNYYDGRYRNYDSYVSDPYYFDPYRRNVSYQYVNSYIPGLNDLDYYGNWQNLDGYGQAWCPRVDTSWAPYQQGYWMTDYPYGPTWVSSEPWGYAPYHYGRWANVSDRWYWIPGSINTVPTYSPALVAWVPLNQNDIGWVPLGPNDAYLPRYYNYDWQPTYLGREDIVQRQLANLYVPGAVTVVPIDQFGRVLDGRNVWRADRQLLSNVNPVLDPLYYTPLRNAAIHSAWGRGKIDIPPGIAKKLYDTPVVTSAAPIALPYRRDIARNFRVETVANDVRGRKFKVQDNRGPGAVAAGPEESRGQGRGRAVENPAAPIQQAPVDARNRGQQQKIDRAQAERPGNAARQQQPVGERVANPERGQGRGQGRPQAAPAPQAPRAQPNPGRVKGGGKPNSNLGPPVRQEAPRAAPRERPVQAQPKQQRQPGPPAQQQAPRAAPRERPVQAQPKQQRQPGPPARQQVPQAAPHGRPAQAQPQQQKQAGPPQKQGGGKPAGNPHGGGQGGPPAGKGGGKEKKP
jgi:hypothetical protein